MSPVMYYLLIRSNNLINQLKRNSFFAYVTFSLILGIFAIPNPSMAAGEKSLEELFEEITLTGTIDSFDYSDEVVIDIPTNGLLELDFSLMLEEAGFANRNSFGIYDTVTQNRFQIFGGEAVLGSQFQATITSDSQLLIGEMTYELEGPLSFYLSREGKKSSKTFYSNDSYDGISQALVYQGEGQQLSFGGVETSFTDNDYIIAFEDQKVHWSDQDFNDLVVFLDTSLILPEPAPALLPSLTPSNNSSIPEPSLLSGLTMMAILGIVRKQALKHQKS